MNVPKGYSYEHLIEKDGKRDFFFSKVHCSILIPYIYYSWIIIKVSHESQFNEDFSKIKYYKKFPQFQFDVLGIK